MGALNMNMNMAAPGSSVGGAGTRVRFNTQDYRKLVALTSSTATEAVIPVNPGVMRFPAYWDADLRSYEYLNEFLCPNYPDWRARLQTFVNAPGAPFDLLPPHRLMPTSLITLEVQQMLDAALGRDDRFAEIIDQHRPKGPTVTFSGCS